MAHPYLKGVDSRIGIAVDAIAAVRHTGILDKAGEGGAAAAALDTSVAAYSCFCLVCIVGAVQISRAEVEEEDSCAHTAV